MTLTYYGSRQPKPVEFLEGGARVCINTNIESYTIEDEEGETSTLWKANAEYLTAEAYQELDLAYKAANDERQTEQDIIMADTIDLILGA